jgi:serine/threonine protein kinase
MDAASSAHPTQQALRSFGLGTLDERSADIVGKHLKQCAGCRKQVAAMSVDSVQGQGRDGPKADGEWNVSQSQPGATQTWRPDRPRAKPPASTIPQELADHPEYEVLRELGRGGMGVVYLAHNRLMGRNEVLKVIGRELLYRPGVRDRFLREIRSAAKLHHINIVKAYSVIRIGEGIAFAMEYVDGLDLAKIVKSKGPLPVSNACHYVYQAALGLQHAHEHGTVHRDIKPSNLMLAVDGKKPVIKVLDFGLAKISSEGEADNGLTREGQMLGTPDYIAPEQIRDAQSADTRADIYSLGCTLYYLLAGRPPFRGDSLWDLYQAHFSMDANPLNLVRPEVPVELAALVTKLMAKEPGRRFQTAGDAAKALSPFFKAAPAPLPTHAAATHFDSAPMPAERSGPVSGETRRATPETAPPLPPNSTNGRGVGLEWDNLIDLERGDPPPNALKAMPLRANSQPEQWLIAWRPLTWPAIAAVSVLVLALALGGTTYLATRNSGNKVDAEQRQTTSETVAGTRAVGVEAHSTVANDRKAVAAENDGGGTEPQAAAAELPAKLPAPRLDEGKALIADPAIFRRNLIVNGDAERFVLDDASKPSGPAKFHGWEQTGNIIRDRYIDYPVNYVGASGEGFGESYFFGGDQPESRLAQTIDLSAAARAIDQGVVGFAFRGWLGIALHGAKGGDTLELELELVDAQGRKSATYTLHAPSVEEFAASNMDSNTDGRVVAVLRTLEGRITPSTRTARLVVTSRLREGKFSNTYADNLSFELRLLQP